jgi:hypothetical protein
MARKLILVILLLFFISSFRSNGQTSYNNFQECTIESRPCSDFIFDLDSRTIIFSVRIPDYYFDKQSVTIDGVTFAQDMNVGMPLENPYVSSCSSIQYSTDSYFSVEQNELVLNPNQNLYIRASDCSIKPDDWFITSYYIQLANSSTSEYPRQAYGRIQKFVETPAYKQKQKWNQYFFRFIPLGIIILISVLGLIRVKRC